jgi:small subunit ribosomal protein S17
MAKKQLKGKIVSNKMEKTVVVSVERIEQNKKYKRRFKTQKNYKADSGENKYNIGDVVLIEECRPISKDKSWKVIERLAESKSAGVLVQDAEILTGEPEEKKPVVEK